MRIFGMWIRLAVLAAAVLGLARAALAEERLALVIGNSAYGSVQPLDNPGRDARLMAETLERLGFDVTLAVDAPQLEMKRAIARFGRRLRGAGEDATGLFYYAGHGVQSFGSNYLLPVDVALSDAADLDLMAVEAQSVLRQMASARNRTNIVILDACRNNPFKAVADLNESGLAEMKAPTGTFLAYATAPGEVALDGEGENSPFTEALAREIVVPGAPVEQVFKQVRRAVLEQSGGGQTPWDTSSLVSDFTFAAAEPEAVMSAAEIEEAQIWRSVKASRDAMQIMLFLRGYGSGKYADEARALLASLMEEELHGGAGAAVAAAPAAAAEPAPAVGAPDAETAMFQAAQGDGSKAAFEAYLMAYPEGRFAELAAAEVAALAAGAGQDPQAGAGSPPAAAEDAPAAVALAETGPITYASPLDTDAAAISGLTLAEAVTRSPSFPPVEGLPESYWKDQSCSSCHQWTRERLCTQGNTYLSLNMQRSLGKQHPFGGALKQALKSWAAGGCQ